jgi:hypothetical protein
LWHGELDGERATGDLIDRTLPTPSFLLSERVGGSVRVVDDGTLKSIQGMHDCFQKSQGINV